MKRPFVWILLIFIVGLMSAQVVAFHGVIGGLIVSMIVGIRAVQLNRRAPVSLASLLLTCAGSLMLLSAAVFSFLLLDLSGVPVLERLAGYSVPGNQIPIEFEARVRHIRRRSTSVTIILDEIQIIRRTKKISVSGRLRIHEWTGPGRSDWSTVDVADRIGLRGTLRALPSPPNPADYDERSYLNSIGVFAGFVPESDPVPLDHTSPGKLSDSILSFREHVIIHLRRSLHSSSARALVPAMLIGEKGFLDSTTREQFRISGLSHLLAISGLHVGILGYSVFWLLGGLLRRTPLGVPLRRTVRASLTFLVLFLFVLLTGSSPSVVRAAIMGVVLIVGTVSARRRDTLNVLAFAAILMIASNPAAIKTPGFQLSFCAVAAILLFNAEPGFVRKIRFIALRQAASLLLVSLYIFAFTYPVVVYHFGEVSIAGVLLNVIAIPAASLFMTSALVSTIWSLAQMPLSHELLFATDFLAASLVMIARAGASVFDKMMLQSPAGQLLPINLLPALLIIPALKTLPTNRSARLGLVASVALGIVLLLSWTSTRVDQRGVSFLNVGQGDAALIVYGDQKCMSIDTGPGYSSYISIKKQLFASGCRRLSRVIVTHDHADHTGGLKYLIEAGLVESIFGPPSILQNVKSRNRPWFKAALSLSIPVQSLSTGDKIQLNQKSGLLVLSPDSSSVNETGRSSGNTSVVAVLYWPGLKVLFMGDAEKEQEKTIVMRFGHLLRSSVVKVGHHGSKTSSLASLVARATIPDSTMALFSYGMPNRFNHPSSLVVNRWRTRKSVIHKHRYFRVLQKE